MIATSPHHVLLLKFPRSSHDVSPAVPSARHIPLYTFQRLFDAVLTNLQDFFIIITSSLARVIPGLKDRNGGGYSRVPANGVANGGRGRGRTADDENRLIDQLDEEWDGE